MVLEVIVRTTSCDVLKNTLMHLKTGRTKKSFLKIFELK